MQYRIGRILQVIGLLIAPQGIAGNLMGLMNEGHSLGVAVLGCAVFCVGYSIQGKT